MIFLDKRRDVRNIFIHCDTHYLETARSVVICDRHKARNFDATRPAPCRPVIYNHNLAALVGKFHVSPLSSRDNVKSVVFCRRSAGDTPNCHHDGGEKKNSKTAPTAKKPNHSSSSLAHRFFRSFCLSVTAIFFILRLARCCLFSHRTRRDRHREVRCRYRVLAR